MINIILGAPRSGTTFLWTLLENYKDVMPLTKETVNLNKKPKKYSTSESGLFITRSYSSIKKFIGNNKDKILIEKTPYHTLIYDNIDKSVIDKTILIYRNPIDIVTSMVHSTTPSVFQSYDINRSIFETKKYFKAMQSILPYADVIVKYEDLVKDTKNLKPILDVLNITDYDYDNFKEQISFSRRKNNKTLNEEQINIAKNQLKDEIVIWENI